MRLIFIRMLETMIQKFKHMINDIFFYFGLRDGFKVHCPDAFKYNEMRTDVENFLKEFIPNKHLYERGSEYHRGMKGLHLYFSHEEHAVMFRLTMGTWNHG